MAFILCIESSARNCTVALAEGDQLLIRKIASTEMGHSREITLLIRDCLKESGKSMQNLDAVALSRGPGSYTGLRVGASCAKGICYANSIPLIAIDTLAIIAEPWMGNQPGSADYIIPLIDARRNEVYYTIYSPTGEAMESTANKILEPGSFQEYNNVIICGDAAEKAKSILEHPNVEFKDSFPDAGNMCMLAYEKFSKQAFADMAYFSPFYLKPPHITTQKKPLF